MTNKVVWIIDGFKRSRVYIGQAWHHAERSILPKELVVGERRQLQPGTLMAQEMPGVIK
jgi:hypothetical protein